MDVFLRTSNKKGFTLVEIIVVLVIIAILAAIAIPAFTGYIDKSKEGVMKHNQGQVIRILQALAIEGNLLMPTLQSPPANNDPRIILRDALNETGFFVTNPINSSSNTVAVSSQGVNQYASLAISQSTTLNLTSAQSSLYPYNATPNAKENLEGSIVITLVTQGAVVYYFHNSKNRNPKGVPFKYKPL